MLQMAFGVCKTLRSFTVACSRFSAFGETLTGSSTVPMHMTGEPKMEEDIGL